MSRNLIHRLFFKLIEPSKFMRVIIRIAFSTIRYPCCPHHFIDQHINVPGTPMREVHLYSSFSNKAPHLMNWFKVLFIIYGLKNMYYIYFTLNQVNFNNPTLNIQKDHNSTYQFVCLQTNCTKLTDVGQSQFSLADDLLQLPIFSICHQQLRWLFSPFIGSHKVGLLYMAEFTFLSVSFYILYPIYLYLKPMTDNKWIMFTLCPVSCVNILRRQMIDNLTTITISEVNFYQAMCEIDCYSATRHAHHRLALERLNKLKQVDMDEQLEEYIDDCLPINRSQWWRLCMLRAFAFLFIVFFINWTCTLGILAGLFTYHSVEDDYRRAFDQLEFANGSECFLRFNESSVDLQPAHIRLDWNYYSAIESVVALIFPVYIITLSITNYFLICKDEKLCILELKEQLKVAINFSVLLNSRRGSQNRFALPNYQASSGLGASFKMAPIRQRLMESIGNFDWCLFNSNNTDTFKKKIKTKLDKKISDQEFALELIDSIGSNNMSSYCKLLEKMQVNYMQFTRLLEQNHQLIEPMLVMSALVNYGLSIIAVYFYRNLDGFVVEPFVLTVTSLTTITYFIAIASDIHCSLKGVQALVWALIGENMNVRDEKVQLHKTLWLRQMIFVERAGGLANRFMGRPITYGAIIKILLWTMTILTVLMK